MADGGGRGGYDGCGCDGDVSGVKVVVVVEEEENEKNGGDEQNVFDSSWVFEEFVVIRHLFVCFVR